MAIRCRTTTSTFLCKYFMLIFYVIAYIGVQIQTLVASVLLRQIHYHVFKFLSEFSLGRGVYTYMYVYCIHVFLTWKTCACPLLH